MFTAAVAITAAPHNKTVSRGDKVTLRCKAIAVPSPTIHWYKNGQVIPNITSYEDKKRVSIILSDY